MYKYLKPEINKFVFFWGGRGGANGVIFSLQLKDKREKGTLYALCSKSGIPIIMKVGAMGLDWGSVCSGTATLCVYKTCFSLLFELVCEFYKFNSVEN